jgi:hypothetical protein
VRASCAAAIAVMAPPQFRWADVVVDLEGRSVEKARRVHHLTEFALLELVEARRRRYPPPATCRRLGNDRRRDQRHTRVHGEPPLQARRRPRPPPLIRTEPWVGHRFSPGGSFVSDLPKLFRNLADFLPRSGGLFFPEEGNACSLRSNHCFPGPARARVFGQEATAAVPLAVRFTEVSRVHGELRQPEGPVNYGVNFNWRSNDYR